MVDLMNGSLDKKELILFGTGKVANRMERVYTSYGYKVKYYCYTSAKGNNVEQYRGKTVLSLDELVEYCKQHENVIVQIASSFESEILPELKGRNLNATILLNNDFRFFRYSKRMDYLYKQGNSYREMALSDSANYRKYFARNLAWEQLDNYNLETDTVNIILSCPKTGSTTIFDSCTASQEMTNPVYISYSMLPFSKEYFEVLSKCKRKYISGVREPISQMISMIYFLWYTRNYLFDSTNKFPDIVDCQYWFDEHFINHKESNSFEIFCDIMKTSCGIIDFYEKEYPAMTGVDLFRYPFDKEKGYTIISEGNFQILVYRLDKLNDLEPEIANYFNAGDFALFSSNRSEDTVYKDIYKRGCEEIKIKREFIDRLYDSKLMKWCYTDEEINAFRNKWDKNIID